MTKRSFDNGSSTRRDLYQEVTDSIIAALERGTVPWEQPWTTGLQRNASTGKAYRGINQLVLWAVMSNRQYPTSLWVTYRQASELGGTVRKGEKGTTIVFWSFPEADEDEQNEKRRFPIARAYTVFNVAQTTLEPSTYEQHLPSRSNDLDETCEAFVARTGAAITHSGDSASYSPATDSITVPELARFVSSAEYYSTLFHELTHWTGHKSRCARKVGRRFGLEAYAAEELVAELGAAFLCAELGVSGKLQHPAYIASWIQILRNDNRAIFTASSLAVKAVEYLCSLEQVAEAA